jgi:hypothetical protein
MFMGCWHPWLSVANVRSSMSSHVIDLGSMKAG